MLRIDSILFQFIQPEHVVLQVLGILGIDGVQFPPGSALGEERPAEKGSEAKQRLREPVVDAPVHLEVVHSLLAVGEGVVRAA